MACASQSREVGLAFLLGSAFSNSAKTTTLNEQANEQENVSENTESESESKTDELK